MVRAALIRRSRRKRRSMALDLAEIGLDQLTDVSLGAGLVFEPLGEIEVANAQIAIHLDECRDVYDI